MSYREQFFALQPPGQALPTDPDSVWGRLLDGLAREYGRTESRSSALVRESDPRQSAVLLPDWERVCGLPGDCAIAWDSTLQARRAAVVAQLTGAGGQRIAYFQQLAALLGLSIRVTEYRPFLTGLSRCGQRLNGDHDVRFSGPWWSGGSVCCAFAAGPVCRGNACWTLPAGKIWNACCASTPRPIPYSSSDTRNKP